MPATPTSILSHWNHRVPGMEQSSANFYGGIESAIASEKLDDVKCERVNISEGGILSAKREYLQVRRKEHVFHICAAPYGNGFFISWWLGEIRSGLFASLASLPYVGFIFRLLAAALYGPRTHNTFSARLVPLWRSPPHAPFGAREGHELQLLPLSPARRAVGLLRVRNGRSRRAS